MTDELSESIEQILIQNRIRALNRQKEAIKRILGEAHSMIDWAVANVEDTKAHLDNTERSLEGNAR